MRPNFAATMLVAGLCLLVAGVSIPASTQTESTGVSLWRGTTKLSDSLGRVSDPGSSQLLTTLTPENCPGIRNRIIQKDALTRTTGTATYRCQVDLRAVVTFIANPTCPSLPPPEGRVVECLDGFTGAYTQTRSYTAAPYPTCAVLGEWTPTEPPAGACTPVSTEQWTLCAMEWGFCSFSGTRTVRYGAGSTWIQREIAATNGGVQCRNSVFGDPAPGITKRCELLSTGTTTPSGTASLSWTPPTQNTDGTALTNLAGFRIHYGTSSTALDQVVQIDNAGVTRYTIGNLIPGTYYFAVRALASSGAESYPSNVVSKVAQ